jgi:MFS family permease
VICLSVFVISVDATIVNVALPTLSRELDADTAQLQWIVDAYTLVIAGLLLSAGSLSDRYGRRGWLAGGLAVFAITSAVAAQVHSADALIAARAAMGVGAAVIFPTTLALITNIFIDPGQRAKAIGVWAAMTGVGVAIVGSVFASVYSGGIGSASAVAALPVEVRSTMERSTAAAYKVIGQLPAERIADVREAVNHAFLHGLQIGALVCAAIALGAAVVVAGLLPARAWQTTPSMTQEPEAAAAVA